METSRLMAKRARMCSTIAS